MEFKIQKGNKAVCKLLITDFSILFFLKFVLICKILIMGLISINLRYVKKQ